MLIVTKKVLTIKTSQAKINDLANIPGVSDRISIYERLMNNSNRKK